MQVQLPKKSRRRGVILTPQGFQKLRQVRLEAELNSTSNKRLTLEALSEKTGLTANTLSKVFIGTTGVDLHTLKCCFSAFNLALEVDDYSDSQSSELQLYSDP